MDFCTADEWKRTGQFFHNMSGQRGGLRDCEDGLSGGDEMQGLAKPQRAQQVASPECCEQTGRDTRGPKWVDVNARHTIHPSH